MLCGHRNLALGFSPYRRSTGFVFTSLSAHS